MMSTTLRMLSRRFWSACVLANRPRSKHSWRDYGGRLLAVARRFLANEEDAHDVLQEAFFSAFRALPNFAGQSRLTTWLHRIVVNAALMKLRSRQRRPECSIDDLLPCLHR